MDVPGKVLRYETFINDVLKEDLKKVNTRHHFMTTELSSYIQLKNTIETMLELGQKEFKTQVDIGCNFLVQAEVSDTSKILVNIGLGHYIEFSLPEALTYVNKKVEHFTEQLERLKVDSSDIKARIKLVLGGIQQLQNISSESVRNQYYL